MLCDYGLRHLEPA
jgi:hypothetical protein